MAGSEARTHALLLPPGHSARERRRINNRRLGPLGHPDTGAGSCLVEHIRLPTVSRPALLQTKTNGDVFASLAGIEPAAFGLEVRRAFHCATGTCEMLRRSTETAPGVGEKSPERRQGALSGHERTRVQAERGTAAGQPVTRCSATKVCWRDVFICFAVLRSCPVCLLVLFKYLSLQYIQRFPFRFLFRSPLCVVFRDVLDR